MPFLLQFYKLIPDLGAILLGPRSHLALARVRQAWSGQAKITELGDTGCIDQDVVDLDVSLHQPSTVNIMQATEHSV